MKVLRAAGLGVAVVLSAAHSSGQSPDRPPTSAAARFGRIQAVDAPAAAAPNPSSVQPAALLVRGQQPQFSPGASPNYPGFSPSWPVIANQTPMGSGGIPPNSGGVFPNPSQPSTGPKVTELRGSPPSTGPAATFSVPHTSGPVQYGVPVPYGAPIPYGAPVPYGVPSGIMSNDRPLSPPPVCPTGDCAQGNSLLTLMDTPLFGGQWMAQPYLFGAAAPRSRFQTNAEMLLWWVQPFKVPSLLTTSSTVASAGILGRPDTRTIFGNDEVGNAFQTGGRFGGTYWLGQNQVWGLDGDIWFLSRNGQSFTFGSPVDPVLARPFFNVNQGIPFSELVAAPGLASGAAQILTSTEMWGAQVNARRYLASNCCSRIDAFAGFRYMSLSDSLQITESFARTPGSNLAIGVPTALSGSVTDRFRTENDFYGAQVGLAGEMRRGRWFLEGRSSIALGSTHQKVEINGSQNILFDTGPQRYEGGLLALPGANIGTFRQNKFAVVPEVTLRLGAYVTPNLRLSVGYNFLYLSSVLRPGEQIDTGLDVTRIPNFPLPGNPTNNAYGRPTVPLRDTGMTAQGISFSLQYQW